MSILRKMLPEDRERVLHMMDVFYHSAAVLSDGSQEIYRADFEACLDPALPLEGYMIMHEGQAAGYIMTAKSFSTEFGKICMWLEDLYLRPEFRGLGLGSTALQEVRSLYPDCILRLEVEDENERAVRTYEQNGFERINYREMISFPEAGDA